MAIASLFAIPVGILIARAPRARRIMMGFGSASQTIPSLAAMALLIPILGIGVLPTLIILALYAIYPMIKNTVVGIEGIPSEILESADALGLNRFQRLRFIELPLAFPAILAGVRVSVAMTIGIATIAAFIGAGGLGEFITQGLALNNMPLVLLGAIPAALLALFADGLLSALENAYMPGSNKVKRATIITLLAGILGVFFIIAFFAVQHKKDESSLVIASKNFTEQIILGEIMAQLIETKTSLKVIRKYNMGSTEIVHQALLKNKIDLYAEYLGTAYLTVMQRELKDKNINLFHEVSDYYIKQFDLLWLAPFGFFNAQSLAIKKELAERFQIYTLSDLVPYAPNLRLAAPPEFIKRPDAMLALKKTYGMRFNNILHMDPNLLHKAIINDEVDMIVVFSTDPRIDEENLVYLRDDKGFSPSYEAAPVIRREKMEAHPEIAKVLALLGGKIDNKTMKNLNAQVDIEKRLPKEVASTFLKDERLD